MISYIVLGCLVALLVFIFSRFRPEATRKLTDNLYTIRSGMVNFYALNTSEGVLLFDTGISPILSMHGFRKLGLLPDRVTRIFLTHTDFDHLGGLSAFPQAEVYLAKEEEQMINRQTARRGVLYNKRLTSYHTMENGETTVVGDTTVRLRLAPGHTPGSAVYIINDRILVSGDLLRLSPKGAILPFLRLMNMNHKQNIHSVEALRTDAGEADYILTGHTGVRGPAVKGTRSL